MGKPSPIDYVRAINPNIADAFQALRKAALQGPLDEKVCELIVLGALANTGQEGSFKVHGRRLLRLGASPVELRQAVLVTIAASTTWSQAVAGLEWIDDLLAEAGK